MSRPALIALVIGAVAAVAGGLWFAFVVVAREEKQEVRAFVEDLVRGDGEAAFKRLSRKLQGEIGSAGELQARWRSTRVKHADLSLDCAQGPSGGRWRVAFSGTIVQLGEKGASMTLGVLDPSDDDCVGTVTADVTREGGSAKIGAFRVDL